MDAFTLFSLVFLERLEALPASLTRSSLPPPLEAPQLGSWKSCLWCKQTLAIKYFTKCACTLPWTY